MPKRRCCDWLSSDDTGADERHGPRHRARRPSAGVLPGRSKALGEADVAVVIGVPMDFRLGFGAVFGQTPS